MPVARQPAMLGPHMPRSEADHDPGVDYGEVFTRRWVVELILDLVGFTADRDLGSMVVVEPSCGTGAFVGPIVERLIASSRIHHRDMRTLGRAIRAFDLLAANAERAGKAAAKLLTVAGLSEEESDALVSEWVTTGDFLLHDHGHSNVDFVVGNPPYIRLENVPRATMDAYRRICQTMRGRADIYVGFIERGLDVLQPGGALAFICADRWMHNQYGTRLRELVTSAYTVESVITLHEVDAFEEDVSAYPAIVVLRNDSMERTVTAKATTVVDTAAGFAEADAQQLSTWLRHGQQETHVSRTYQASRAQGWFSGRDPWPAGSPRQLALIADLEARFPPLEDVLTGTRVGVGVATGCDDVFLTRDPDLVEEDRLLPLVRARDTTSGRIDWSGTFLVNPWDGQGLVDLADHPRLTTYLSEHAPRLRDRHVARRTPATWFRTIDRVHEGLTARAKLVLPDIKAAAHPVLDEGGYYPHHNLYYVVSRTWNLEVLGGLLLSDVANLLVGAYCVRMRGGTYRFQAQYLRRIRVPQQRSLTRPWVRELVRAFQDRDRERASSAAARIYGISPQMATLRRPSPGA